MQAHVPRTRSLSTDSAAIARHRISATRILSCSSDRPRPKTLRLAKNCNGTSPDRVCPIQNQQFHKTNEVRTNDNGELEFTVLFPNCVQTISGAAVLGTATNGNTDHLSYMGGRNPNRCPDDFIRVPQLALKVRYPDAAVTESEDWALASDLMVRANGGDAPKGIRCEKRSGRGVHHNTSRRPENRAVRELFPSTRRTTR